MRIDLPDVPDAPDNAEVAQKQASADKDWGAALRDNEHLGSSPTAVDSAVRIERSAAYRAVVEAAYRQYAINNAGEAGKTAAADAPSGARGPASGRDFDPESAGGPIRQLDAGKAEITKEGVQEVAAHLRRFTGDGPLAAPEQGMLDRLTSIASGDMKPTTYDQNFFTHELDEAGRYAQIGFGPESGVDLGSDEMYEVWNDVHTAALEDYRVRGTDLFYPGMGP